ncbi:type I restriction-modification system subunit M [Dehalococcoidia bacterium]|nr:type I restriction-modification system subunit M [Dehalococcoidia bacterium]MCL0091175.1 type I restriction-modification system subunit M [Dehalococcoidia bacterium]
MNNRNLKLDITTLENWLWEAACKIRGEIDAPKYKDYILPLIFLKRLSDVFEDEVNKLAESYGDTDLAKQLIDEDHGLVRIYLPVRARWPAVAKQTTGLGEYLTTSVRSIARENPKLQGVIDIVDFNARAAGQPIIGDDRLRALIDVLGRHRLGLQDVEPDILGRAYEYLLRKFAEGSGQSAGEFYTPREVAILISYILDPAQGQEIYDPCCGSTGLLIKCYLRFKAKYGEDPSIDFPKFFGQEILHSTFAMARMNSFIHDMEADVRLGDSMNRPAFLNDDGSLKKFDIVTANPMWNQDFPQQSYENDPYNRFSSGYPPSSSADWGWIQHMYASLRDKGKMAVVLDTGAVSRGSGNMGRNRERDIRKEFVDRDLVEAVILMPENMFYNTTAPGIILVINKNKRKPGEILLINASNLYEKGRPKNFLPESSIERISNLYLGWEEENGVSKVVAKEEVIKNDYNISPSRYVAQNGIDDTLPLDDAVVQLKEAEEERRETDAKLREVLSRLGITL